MIRSHRYFHFFTAVSDKPGGLAKLLEAVAAQGGNVMEVTHNRISSGVAYGMTGVEMLVEVRNEAHITALTASLTDCGYPVRRLD
jgi:threonine dehydratase